MDNGWHHLTKCYFFRTFLSLGTWHNWCSDGYQLCMPSGHYKVDVNSLYYWFMTSSMNNWHISWYMSYVLFGSFWAYLVSWKNSCWHVWDLIRVAHFYLIKMTPIESSLCFDSDMKWDSCKLLSTAKLMNFPLNQLYGVVWPQKGIVITENKVLSWNTDFKSSSSSIKSLFMT